MSNPIINISKLSAEIAASTDSQKILLIAQKSSTGSATAGTVNQDVSVNNILDLGGEKSMVSSAVQSFSQLVENSGSAKAPRLDFLALEDDGAGSKATGGLVLTEQGTSTGNYSGDTKSVEFEVGNKKLVIDFIDGKSFSDIIDTIVTDITNDKFMPVTATNDFTANKKLALEYAHFGTEGNDIHLALDTVKVGNVVLSLEAFSGGAGNPDVATIMDNVNSRYQAIVTVGSYDLDFVTKNYLEGRFNAANNIMDGSCYAHKTGTKAELQAYGESRNFRTEVMLGTRKENDTFMQGNCLADFSLNTALATALAIHIKLVDEASIALLTPNAQAKDASGGMHLASLPFANTPLLHLDAIREGYGFAYEDDLQLQDAGIARISSNDTNTGLVLGTIVTTYKTDAAGNQDPTWRFQNTVLQMSVVVEYIFRNLKKELVQTRLTSGELVGGHGMESKASIISKMVKYYKALAEETILVKGKPAEDYFRKSLDVTLDMVNGKVELSGNTPVVSQLRKVIAALQVAFR